MSDTATTRLLVQQFTDAFNAKALKGIETFQSSHDGQPVLSHICFKFEDAAAYKNYVEAAHDLGTVSAEQFNDKEITWCRLKTPLQDKGLILEWLELVEPKEEKNAFNGVTSIGYAVQGLDKTVKLATDNPDVIYRYQSTHAAVLSGQK